LIKNVSESSYYLNLVYLEGRFLEEEKHSVFHLDEKAETAFMRLM